MRTILSILIFAVSLSANAADENKSYTCLADDGVMISYNVGYGELAIIKKGGEVLVDYDDGYNITMKIVETNPPTLEFTVAHHEEPHEPVMQFWYKNKLETPYKGYYKDANGNYVDMHCL